MINPLSIATNGYLSRDKKRLSIAVDGYLSPFVYFEIQSETIEKLRKAGLLKVKTHQDRLREDEEVLLIINLFMKVWA